MVKVEKVEKVLGHTTEILSVFYKQSVLQQQNGGVSFAELNYRPAELKIISSVTFLHWETDSQK